MTSRLRRLWNRIRYRRFADDMVEELAVHRAMKAQELTETPTVSQAAQPTVSRAMGNELRMRELAREVWVPPSLDALGQDLRDAFRIVVRRPLMTGMSVAALLVGVGATTIAFLLLDALLLRPLTTRKRRGSAVWIIASITGRPCETP